jgi:hypothetical protein
MESVAATIRFTTICLLFRPDQAVLQDDAVTTSTNDSKKKL